MLDISCLGSKATTQFGAASGMHQKTAGQWKRDWIRSSLGIKANSSAAYVHFLTEVEGLPLLLSNNGAGQSKVFAVRLTSSLGSVQ